MRVLQLGDSHIAADYITGTVRERLQDRFGEAGRGFVHAEQRHDYGGRRLDRKGPWRRTRAVDPGQEGKAFGYSLISLESRGPGARVSYAIHDDDVVAIDYVTHAQGGSFTVSVGGKELGRVSTKSAREGAGAKSFKLPARASSKDSRALVIAASGPGVKLLGLRFSKRAPGLLWESIGPVGANANTYVTAQRQVLEDHLKLEPAPDLVVIMLGGNDALRVRKRQASFDEVRGDFEELIDTVRRATPGADCMLWAPMDAGDMVKGKVVSKTLITEMKEIQHEVALAKGCAYWDMHAAMGGVGSIAKWFAAKIINEDLIHPRRKAGLLLGHLFARAWFDAYEGAQRLSRSE